MTGRKILTRTAPIVGSLPVAIDCKAVAGILADHWHTALMGEELITRSGDVRAGVNPRSRACSAILAVVVIAFMDCKSMMWRRGKVHHLALARGE
jgi:hypothetical protein